MKNEEYLFGYALIQLRCLEVRLHLGIVNRACSALGSRELSLAATCDSASLAVVRIATPALFLLCYRNVCMCVTEGTKVSG